MLYPERMNSTAVPSSSLPRHSVSASLVPADSPKRSGQLHQTQVGKMKLRGQKNASVGRGAPALVQRTTPARPPVCLSCSFINLGNFSCWRSDTLNNVDCGCFLPFDRGKKSSKPCFEHLDDLLLRAGIKKKKKEKKIHPLLLMALLPR